MTRPARRRKGREVLRLHVTAPRVNKNWLIEGHWYPCGHADSRDCRKRSLRLFREVLPRPRKKRT